jgi:glycerol kinase
MDLVTLDWSSDMLALFGVDASMLASIRPSSTHFGTVSGDVVESLAGVPITGILGDQQAALFGQACFEPGMVKATYGTGAFVLANAGTTVPRVVDGLVTSLAWDLGAFGPTSYALEGSAFVAGAAVQWLRDLGLIGASHELEALATSVADSAGSQFVPAFTGLGSPFSRAARSPVLVTASDADRSRALSWRPSPIKCERSLTPFVTAVSRYANCAVTGEPPRWICS